MSVKRGFNVDVCMIPGRKIVKLAHRTTCVASVPSLRIRIPFGIEAEHLLQRMKHAVVKEALARGDVAQSRRLEHPAVFGMFLEVGPQRTTESKVIKGRIRICGN